MVGTAKKALIQDHKYPWSLRNMFVDMLHIKADNSDMRWPLVNDGYVIAFDRYENEAFTRDRKLPIVGSYNTKAFLLITEDSLELHFNPSRYQRSENLFGVTYEDAIKIANSILEELDLKPLQQFNVTRADLTLNLEAGKNLKEYLINLKRQKLSRMKTVGKWDSVLYRNTRKSITVYDKGAEIQAHALRDAKKWASTMGQNHVYAELRHVEKVKKYCDEKGIARLEIRLGRHYLRDAEIRDGNQITTQKLKDVFMKETAEIISEVEEFEMDKMKLPRQYMATYLLWKDGRNPKDYVSKNTYYLHRKYILENVGIDIAIHPSLDAEYQRKRQKFRIVEAEIPDGYVVPFREKT